MQFQMFWLVLSVVCVVWYSTITVYVAIKGFWDIKSMLERLAAPDDENAVNR